MSLPEEPYLSVVVSARHDDHGGNLLGRMQIFVSGWIEQARRFQIPSELIIVEWNPLPDRARLIDVLHWPADLGPTTVRFIEVPPELHARYPHGDALPLYQMIAKNVGIRRARGQFVLATNIDILFNDELAAFIGARRFLPGFMYRIDRYDAMSEVPPDAPVAEQLAWCRTHLLRVNARYGTFKVTPDGLPQLSAGDIAAPASGIVPGSGWFSPESHIPGEIFRWAGDSAEILFNPLPLPGQSLLLELEPGPSTGGQPLELEIEAGDAVVRQAIASRSRLRLHFNTACPRAIRLTTLPGPLRVNLDPRPLSFRIFHAAWEPVRHAPPATRSSAHFSVTVEAVPRQSRIVAAWQALMYVVGKLARGGPLVSLSVPVPPKLRRVLKYYVDWVGVTGMFRHLGLLLRTWPLRSPLGADILAPTTGITLGAGWFTLDRFRDRAFRRVSGSAELVLHSPAPQAQLELELEPVPAAPLCLRLVDEAGRSVADSVAEAATTGAAPVSFTVPCVPGLSQVLRLECRDAQGNSAACRVYRCQWSPAATGAATSELPWGAGWRLDPASGARLSEGASELVVRARLGPLFLDLESAIPATFELRDGAGTLVAEFSLSGRGVRPVSLGPPSEHTRVLQLRASAPFRAYYCGSVDPAELGLRVFPEPDQSAPDFLHTNACGDFTLLSKEQWFNLRGYAEMDLYSMNLDSLFCFAAHYAGAREKLLPEPLRIYHIEHGMGSGWTPEGQAKLYERLAAKGLSFIENDEVLGMATQMRRFGAPMIFNHQDWGLGDSSLRETLVPSRQDAAE